MPKPWIIQFKHLKSVGKKHRGNSCYFETSVYFRCGKLDHKIKDCPLPKEPRVTNPNNEGNNDKRLVQGRVYTLAPQRTYDTN